VKAGYQAVYDADLKGYFVVPAISRTTVS
jgi:hypothetical protein